MIFGLFSNAKETCVLSCPLSFIIFTMKIWHLLTGLKDWMARAIGKFRWLWFLLKLEQWLWVSAYHPCVVHYRYLNFWNVGRGFWMITLESNYDYNFFSGCSCFLRPSFFIQEEGNSETKYMSSLSTSELSNKVNLIQNNEIYYFLSL